MRGEKKSGGHTGNIQEGNNKKETISQLDQENLYRYSYWSIYQVHEDNLVVLPLIRVAVVRFVMMAGRSVRAKEMKMKVIQSITHNNQ
mmetsp:Transcript_33381/g.49126  ORF Transcript_33381/g.49126 Transcript_33381/m.49126 type:complete len:88 (-) Transcript_33381:813-1076(-)